MNRFKITKIGLLNFWLYDEEEYDFYGGNLILRGINGSGKSVTMQSFIPLILDGNKNPDRLDPFGSKERKIEDYILGDSESIQKEESTAYLYMETFLESENKYITIGLGFRGRKGKPVDSWGFALKNGQRIRKDFFLYKDSANKIPLSKKELKGRLGTENEMYETMKEYKAMVNRLLFGFPTIETYDEFIKLLLQLRSNKLSKDYKPTNLVNVLNTVLQPLSQDDLRPLSEAIEQMNKTKEQVETLEKNSKCLKDFLKVYHKYNEIVLLTKARDYKSINIEYKETENKLNKLNKDFQSSQKLLTEKNTRNNKVIEEIEINKENKKKLDNHDLKQKIEELAQIKEAILDLESKIKQTNEKINVNDELKIDIQNKINQMDNEVYHIKKELSELNIDLKELAHDSYFNELIYFLEDFREDEVIDFENILIALNNYSNKINNMIHHLEEEQKILIESESTRIEHEKLNKKLEKNEEDLSNQQNNLKESIMAWQEDFININNNNKHLKLNELARKEIFDLMNHYSSSNFQKAVNIFKNYAQELINSVISNNLILENKKNDRAKDLLDLKSEYVALKESDDIELSSLNEKTDELLKENNIESIPLYKCLEFKEGMDDKIKNNIESSLLNLNLLNAKIISEKDIAKVTKLNTEILYLTKTTKKKNNLLKYFNIKLQKDTTINEKYIEEILESISVDKNEVLSIGEDGISKVDVMNLISDSEYKQTYIGYLKRLELKNKKLDELNEKITILTKEINNISNLIQENNNKKEIIEREINSFPNNELINNIEERVKEITFEIDYNNKKQKELETVLNEINEKLKKVTNEINEYKKGLNIPTNLKSYKEVSAIINSIKDLLQKLKSIHINYLAKLEIKKSNEDRLEDIIINLDYLTNELTEKEKDLKVNISVKDTIEKILDSKEYKEQKEKLLQIEENLQKLEREKIELVAEIAKLQNEFEHLEKEINVTKDALFQKEKILKIEEEIFLREYKLHYVYEEEIINLNDTVEKIIKDGTLKKVTTIADEINNFYNAYNHYKLELNDYSLKDIALFADYQTEDEKEKEIYSNNVRRDVIAMYQGIKVNIIELSQKIESDILENKDLISKQDRNLFEDILLNTVGDKIRKRIESSNNWVKKINAIMETMQENSALRFKLVWKSISADKEDEIDTKELVRILKIDPKLLKESDAEKLTNHFRSKIKHAEELYEDSYISFYKIIEEVLDYRSWFTFQLFYQRKGMELKELTDKTFSKFSGGERAKSMYIPLFASCYAKFNLARSNALRIIALDEAFAGVDEENIREMFGILKFLDLNFIINSQVLWGDYDTIDDLSICEIIRPNNSQVVTVERYRWNGKYKEIINNRNDYLGDNSNA